MPAPKPTFPTFPSVSPPCVSVCVLYFPLGVFPSFPSLVHVLRSRDVDGAVGNSRLSDGRQRFELTMRERSMGMFATRHHKFAGPQAIGARPTAAAAATVPTYANRSTRRSQGCS